MTEPRVTPDPTPSSAAWEEYAEGLRAERDNALAEVARLRELVGDEDYDRDRWATCSRAEAIRQANSFHEAAMKWVTEHNARRDERDALAARLERAEAERDAMRAVVEAAEAWRDGWSPPWTRALTAEGRRDLSGSKLHALIAAVDTYRAATPSTPEAGP